MYFYKIILFDGTTYEGTCMRPKRIIEINSIRKSAIKSAYFDQEKIKAYTENDDTLLLEKIKKMTQKELIEFQKNLRSI
jgi:hypothetical protein